MFHHTQNFVNMMVSGASRQDFWITADTHFNHKNICRGVTDWRMPDGSVPISQTRDFPDLDAMNDAIVNGINNVVGQYDVLIHLGDWSFGGFESIQKFYDRLICKNIYLYLGNHDHHIKKNKNGIKSLFLGVYEENDEYKFERHMFHINHYPILSWKDIKKGTIHLHGHTHFKGDDRFGKGKMMDIGIDGHPEFRPYNLLTEIIPLMDNRPIKSQYNNGVDHHVDRIRHKY